MTIKRYKKYPATLRDVINWMLECDLVVPNTNRRPKWDPSYGVSYVKTGLAGLPLGTYTLWRSPPKVDVPRQQMFIDESNREFSKNPLNALDANNRLRFILSMITGEPVAMSKNKTVREKGFKLAYNPQTRQVTKYVATMVKDPAWMTDMTIFWKSNLEMPVEVSSYVRQLTDLYIEKNHRSIFNIFNEQVGAIDKDLAETIRCNIYDMVTLIDEEITIQEVFASTLDEAADIFKIINTGMPVTVLENIIIQIHNRSNYIGSLLRTFSMNNTFDWFTKEEDDVVAAILTILARRFNKDTPRWQKLVEKTDLVRLKKLSEVVANTSNFDNYINNVVKHAGLIELNAYKITSKFLVPMLYTLYCDALFTYKIKDVDKLCSYLSELFFVLSVTKREFSNNATDAVGTWLSQLPHKMTEEQYFENLLYFNVTMRNENSKDLYNFFYKAKGKTSLAFSTITAMLIINNETAFLTKSVNVRVALLKLHKHHMAPKKHKQYPKEITVDTTGILERTMNFALTTKDLNNDFSNGDITNYVKHYLSSMYDFSDEHLRFHGYNRNWFGDDQKVTIEYLEQLYSLRAAIFVEVFNETADLLRYGKRATTKSIEESIKQIKSLQKKINKC